MIKRAAIVGKGKSIGVEMLFGINSKAIYQVHDSYLEVLTIRQINWRRLMLAKAREAEFQVDYKQIVNLYKKQMFFEFITHIYMKLQKSKSIYIESFLAKKQILQT